ncbi:response regulator transcription factor [Flavilitoribacter nigricans]|nr:response regulator transcription factor [Flavilitoribacter nigricans]
MSDIRVLIVEDEALIAKDIQFILEDADYSVSAIAYNSKKALEELRNRTPDIVLLDIQLNSELSGIQLAKIINEQYQLPFIFITSYADRATIEKVKSTNPMGYLVKPFEERTLITTIEIALYNHAQLWADQRPNLSFKLINQKLSNPLTDREFATLQQLLQGKTNKQIASDLYVSTNTVKTHLSNLFLKFDVSSRSMLFTRVNQLLRAS